MATCRRSMLALGAEIVVRGSGGERVIPADEFFVDYYTTALRTGELVTAIRIPGGQSRGAYVKFNRRAIDWALVGAAVSQGPQGWRVGLVGVAPTAVRARGVEEALAQGRRTPMRRLARRRASIRRPAWTARRSTSAISPPCSSGGPSRLRGEWRFPAALIPEFVPAAAGTVRSCATRR